MDWLSWVLFESLAALAAVLVTGLFVVLVYWRRSGNVRPLLVGLGLAVVLLALQWLVVTHREHAGRVLVTIEQDLRRGRATALGTALAPGFVAGERDREQFIGYVERRLRQIRIHWLERTRLQMVESNGGRFVILAGYVADVGGQYSGRIPSRWRIEFTRTPAGWQITAIEPEMLAFQENMTWPALDRL